MKKLISCLLAVLLVCSLMSMSVFAAVNDYPDGGKVSGEGDYDVVGSQGNNAGDPDKSYDDGVGKEAVDDKTISGDITINFNAATSTTPNDSVIVDKYAIDIEYTDLIIDLTDIDTTGASGEEYRIIWDVNKHEYVQVGSDDTVEDSDPITNEYVKDAYKITNHSSAPIYYRGALTPDSNKPASVTVTLGEDNAWQTLERSTPQTQAITTQEYHKITVTPATDWVATINDLTNAYAAATSTVIGTITVSFAADEPTP